MTFAQLGILIPLGSIVLIGFIIWVGIQKEMHARSLLHKEIMSAIEKGVDVPLAGSGTTPLDYLRKGIIWAVIGLLIIIGFMFEGEFGAAGLLGSIPLAIGLGNITYYKFTLSQEKE
ncbi:MAG: DUF6249 domain-containing protein [Candidatus Marinimicrobia bacterium]|nr:DUF6249 domain-containing protein [Candidatus Neomarinimicrobiota bacterium]